LVDESHLEWDLNHFRRSLWKKQNKNWKNWW